MCVCVCKCVCVCVCVCVYIHIIYIYMYIYVYIPLGRVGAQQADTPVSLQRINIMSELYNTSVAIYQEQVYRESESVNARERGRAV